MCIQNLPVELLSKISGCFSSSQDILNQACLFKDWQHPAIRELYRDISIKSLTQAHNLLTALSSDSTLLPFVRVFRMYCLYSLLPNSQVEEIMFIETSATILHILPKIHTIIFKAGHHCPSKTRLQALSKVLFPAIQPSVSMFYFVVRNIT